MTANARKVPGWVWTAVKVAIVVAVVWWMFHAKMIRLDEMRSAVGRWPLLAAALASILAGIFLSSFRWGILLRAQGIHIPVGELFTLMMKGAFFTAVTPGGLGGDAVKAYYVARGREKKAEAATTVFLDRLLGFATLFAVAGVMMLVEFRRLWDATAKGVEWFGIPFGRLLVFVIGGSILALAVFGLLVTSKRVRRTGVLQWLSRFVPFRPTAAKVYEAMHLYGDHRGAVCTAALVSVAAQVPLYLIYYLCGHAVGAPVELWQCVLIVPPATVIRVIPLMPGGAGQGLVAMSLLFPLVGISQGAAIGALGDGIFVVVYLIGGLFFLFGRQSYGELHPPDSSIPQDSGGTGQ